MQLFTIGLVKLNQDGTVVVDETTGEPVPTYGNDDISKFSVTFVETFIDLGAQHLIFRVSSLVCLHSDVLEGLDWI